MYREVVVDPLRAPEGCRAQGSLLVVAHDELPQLLPQGYTQVSIDPPEDGLAGSGGGVKIV